MQVSKPKISSAHENAIKRQLLSVKVSGLIGGGEAEMAGGTRSKDRHADEYVATALLNPRFTDRRYVHTIDNAVEDDDAQFGLYNFFFHDGRYFSFVSDIGNKPAHLMITNSHGDDKMIAELLQADNATLQNLWLSQVLYRHGIGLLSIVSEGRGHGASQELKLIYRLFSVVFIYDAAELQGQILRVGNTYSDNYDLEWMSGEVDLTPPVRSSMIRHLLVPDFMFQIVDCMGFSGNIIPVGLAEKNDGVTVPDYESAIRNLLRTGTSQFLAHIMRLPIPNECLSK